MKKTLRSVIPHARFFEKAVRLPLLLFMLLLLPAALYAQDPDITISELTGGIAPTPLLSGSTNQAILGIRFDKDDGGTNSITEIVITLDEDPAGKYQNIRLYRSNDDNFDAGDVSPANLAGTVTVGTSSITISDSPVTSFSGDTDAATRRYFLVADVNPSVTTATAPIKATLEASNVTIDNDDVLGSDFDGLAYSFTEPVVTIGSLNAGANNVATSPLAATAVNRAILGFSLTSNTTQTVDGVTVQVTSDPASKWGTYSLIRSGDTNFASGGDNVPVTATITASATEITITGISESISSQKNYFLVTNIDPGVTAATPAIQASLGSSDVSATSGSVTGSATGTNYSFTTLATTAAQLTNGVAPSPLGSGATNQAILGFSLTTNGSIDFTGVTIPLTSTAFGKFANIRLFVSSNNSFGGDASIGASVDTTGSQLAFSGFTQALSGTKNYFVVADIVSTVTSATPQVRPSFTAANVVLSTGSVTATTFNGTNYSFDDIIDPTLSSTVPSDNATGISIGLNTLEATFSETVVYVGDNSDNDNKIRIRTGGSDFYTILTTDVSVSGNVVTMTFPATLSAGTGYAIRIGNSVFEDLSGNAFTGIGNDTDWNFTIENAPNITGYVPSSICVGDTVRINGTGFGSSPTVTINGVSATVITSSPFLTVKIPNTTTGTVVVTNTSNSLSDSDGGLTLKPAIATSLPIAANPPSPALSENYSIEVDNTQSTVNYAIREVPAGFGSTTGGNGATLTFGPYNKNVAAVYKYLVRATSAGCTPRTYDTVYVNIVQVTASAGSDKTICQGESVVIGGSPTASGGTGYHQIIWSGPGYSGNNPNPSVSVGGTYNLTVKDNNGNTDTDDVEVTITPLPTVSYLTGTQVKSTFSDQDSVYLLSNKVTVSPAGGTLAFSGLGVSAHSGGNYYFDPRTTGAQTNLPVTASYTLNNCTNTDTLNVNVFPANAVINLEEAYCGNRAQSGTLTHNPSYIPPPDALYTYSFSRLGFYSCYTSPYAIPTSHINYPMIDVGGGGYRIDLQKAKTFNPPGASCYYILVWYNIYNKSDGTFVGENYFGYKYFDIVEIGKEPIITSITEGQKICSDAAPIQLFTSISQYVTNSFSINDGLDNSVTLSGGDAFFDPSEISFASETSKSFTITYDYNDDNSRPIGGCQNTVTRNLTVVNKPEAPVAADEQYCQFFTGRRTLTAASNIGSTDFFWYENTTLVGVGPTFDTEISTANPTNKLYTVKQAVDGCQGQPDNATVIITPSPDITFSVPPQCEQREALITGPVQDVIEWLWNFGDGSKDSTTVGPSGEMINHTYLNPGVYTLKLQVKSLNNGQECFNSTEKQVTVGQNPVATFDYNYVCDQDNTELHGNADIPVRRFRWDFADADTLGAGTGTKAIPGGKHAGRTSGTYQNPRHRFEEGSDDYLVQLITYTNLGCSDTVQRNIAILPYLTYTGSNPYLMANEDGGKGFWAVEDDRGNSSWDFAPGASTIIHSVNPVWTTGAASDYLPNDLSYVNSPCLNISGVARPVFSLNLISNTQPGFDGAALQYSADGGVTWSNVGTKGSGTNWFNETGFSIPGGSQAWTGNLWDADTTWLEAKRALDDIGPRNKIRFRIAFTSGSEGQAEGFAFNNVKIEERNRVMLVENFTNTGAPNATVNDTEFYDLPGAELVRLEYHTSYPDPDPLSERNIAEHNARAAFYGISNTTTLIPRVYIDGASGGSLVPPNAWFPAKALLRALSSAPFSITLETTPAGASELDVRAAFKPRVPITTGKPVAHIAVIEKTVGANQFVLRKFLGSVTGTAIPLPQADTTVSFVIDPPAWRVSNVADPSEIALIAFVQDEDTKEIYQAEYLESPANLPTDIITGNEPSFTDQVIIYPNPAQGQLNIELPKKMSTSLPVSLTDNFGREVYMNAFKPGERSKTINTGDLAAGVYILQIQSDKGEIARKKVIVVGR